MPKVQYQPLGTPGTQVSISDDFDAEAQARLEELIKQAKISVESKAKAEFQQLKTNTEKKMKELARKRVHMTRTHLEEFEQVTSSYTKELLELVQEERELLASYCELLNEKETQTSYNALIHRSVDAATQLDQINIGCLTVLRDLHESQRAVPPRVYDGWMPVIQFDSGRNHSGNPRGGVDLLDGGSEDGRQGNDMEMINMGLQSTSNKKKRAAKRR